MKTHTRREVLARLSFILPSTFYSLNRLSSQRLSAGDSVPIEQQIKSKKGKVSSSSKRNGFGKAKSCIILFAWGGMSHIDTFDPKPLAPVNYRGEFKPITTKVPGIQISEHLPRLAKRTDSLAIIRSGYHKSSAHGKGMYWNLTGHPPPNPEVATNQMATSMDYPWIGSVIAKIRGNHIGRPGCALLPYPMWDNNTRQGGHDAGWLGRAYDPIIARPKQGIMYKGVSREIGTISLELPQGVSPERSKHRQQLLADFEQSQFKSVGQAIPTTNSFERYRQLANEMMFSKSIQEAFTVEKEEPKIRASYGNHICGQSVLLARRLTETGIPLVGVCCAAGDLNGSAGDHWDTHGNNFNRLKNDMLPPFDQAFSALIDDLKMRGTFEETLVVVLTDFGRTPLINGAAGRDHYPNCFSVIFAGGGIQGGQIYGKSDRLGAAPLDLGCGPADFHATIYHALGIDLDTQISDSFGRPLALTDGGKVLPLFGS